MSGSSFWVHAHQFEPKSFKGWLREQGGVGILKPVGDYELCRYQYDGTTHIVWRKPSKGRVTFTKSSWKHYQQFLEGGKLAAPIKVFDGKRQELLLYTDAGHSRDTGTGSWAGVLVIGDVVCDASGAMRGDIDSTSGAEAMAVANSLHSFIKTGIIRPHALVHIYCDNKGVVQKLKRWPGPQGKKCHPQIKEGIDAVYALAERLKLRLQNLFSKWS